MKKSPVYTLQCDKYTFQFRQLSIGDPVRLSALVNELPLPYRLYLPAYDAFKVSCFGLGAVADRMKAGIVLNVGMVVLEQSKFMNPVSKVQEDLVVARAALMGFFDQVRNLAMLYFNYKLEESASWTYDNILEMASRLEQAAGIDLTIDRPEEEQPEQRSAPQQTQRSRRTNIEEEALARLRVEPGAMVIKKGDVVSSDKMSYHNASKSTK